ncbi:MAG: hypothetical protein H6636_12210 [Anaerolineales bacterium]|nr:hypothetical protein [Anaerolineales bacterium]
MKRFTFLKFAIIVVLVFGGMFSLSPVHGARAATIMVDSAADNLTAGDTLCTLREAIRNANLPLGGDLTSGDCETADSGLDTIVFASSLDTTPITLSITGSGEDAAAQGDLDITGSVTITGNGAGKTIIDANGIDRVFQLFSGITVTINDLTIQGGNRTGTHPTGSGAGILSEATLILNNVKISGNTAGDRGGGIYGGYNASGSTTLNHVYVTGNTAGGRGGGLYFAGGTSTVSNSTISSNTVIAPGTSGGGIFVGETNVSLSMNNSTLSGNTANDSGGGLALYQSGSTVTAFLNHVTVAFNTANAASSGGGGGIARISAGTLNLGNSIVSNNTSSNGPDCRGTISTLGYNVTGSSCTLGGTGDTVADPLLSALADNGGSTLTHALAFNSPAIDKVLASDSTNNGCGTTYTSDQRGVARPIDGNGNVSTNADCDAGAYEALQACGVVDATSYTRGDVTFDVQTANDIFCLQVKPYNSNHPNATITNLQTGKYWQLDALNSSGLSASGYDITLTIANLTFTADTSDKLCRWDGAAWDCGTTNTPSGTSIMRTGVTALSPWTAGNNVGPTAIALQTFTAHSTTLPIALAALSFLSVALLLLLWRKKNHIPQA